MSLSWKKGRPIRQVGGGRSDLQGERSLLGHVAAVQTLQWHCGVVRHDRDLVDPSRELAEELLRPPLGVAGEESGDRVQGGERVHLVGGDGEGDVPGAGLLAEGVQEGE